MTALIMRLVEKLLETRPRSATAVVRELNELTRSKPADTGGNRQPHSPGERRQPEERERLKERLRRLSPQVAVRCPFCGVETKAKNLIGHCDKHHPDYPAAEPPQGAREQLPTKTVVDCPFCALGKQNLSRPCDKYQPNREHQHGFEEVDDAGEGPGWLLVMCWAVKGATGPKTPPRDKQRHAAEVGESSHFFGPNSLCDN
jgi:hypothetical protein